MDNIELVKAYYAALDANALSQVDEYLSKQYQLIDFMPQPMNREAMLNLFKLLKMAMPNLSYSLSNMRMEEGVVKFTMQRSGTHSNVLDLTSMGLGVVPPTQRFIIFPNTNVEITLFDGKIIIERDVSPQSPNRRMSGLLKSLGVNMAGI